MNIPDSINFSQLNELLTAKQSHLPEIPFSSEHPCELSLLIGMLAMRAPEGRKVDLSHLLHASMSLLATLGHGISEAVKRLEDRTGPGSVCVAIELATSMALINTASSSVERALFMYAELHDIAFDGTTSEEFIAALGISQEEMDNFRDKCRKEL
jgi:hypothetical protein